MKYLRKMVTLLIGIVFFAALIICVGRIFAIKNINVNLIAYEQDGSENYKKAKEALSVYKGESLLFLSEKDIVKAIEGTNYSLTSCEKKFPCTVNVTIKERLEIFAVSVGELYSMYDGDGGFLRKSRINANDIDGNPNVELKGVVIEQIRSIAEIVSEFRTNFGGLRSIVKSIELDSDSRIEGYTEKLRFNLRCGIIVQLDDYSDGYKEKISAAYKKFYALSDREKLGGKIRSYRIGGSDGLINADYSIS